MLWIKKTAGHPSWLSDYCSYLSNHCSTFLNIPLLESWIDSYTISTDIPIGYGLGSSGALTAAIYDIAHHSNSKDESTSNLTELQRMLGLMESFFHGKSSGFDPLISYLQMPILRKEGELDILLPDAVNLPVYCYLLDSGRGRSGKDMIAKFLERYDSNKNRIDQLCELNNKVIDQSMTRARAGEFYKNVKYISSLQQEVMYYMIIDDVKSYWLEGLQSDDYYLKICGAGGGGYYLVFSMNEIEKIGPYQLQRVFTQKA